MCCGGRRSALCAPSQLAQPGPPYTRVISRLLCWWGWVTRPGVSQVCWAGGSQGFGETHKGGPGSPACSLRPRTSLPCRALGPGPAAEPSGCPDSAPLRAAGRRQLLGTSPEWPLGPVQFERQRVTVCSRAAPKPGRHVVRSEGALCREEAEDVRGVRGGLVGSGGVGSTWWLQQEEARLPCHLL